MLKIQLCPASELENKQWWIPDVVVLVIATGAIWFGVDTYLSNIRNEITHLNATAATWEKKSAELAPIVAKFTSLDKEIVELNKKIDVLTKITVSKVDKVLPIVVMDQLQTLAPMGVWYQSLEFKRDRTIELQGASNDSLLVSEFLLGLRETMNPQTWTNDVRTQIGYTEIKIGQMARIAVDQNFSDQKGVLQFGVTARVNEKPAPHPAGNPTVPLARSSNSSNSFKYD